MSEQELEEYYTMEEIEMYKKLIGYGLNEVIAMDCMSSRTIGEMDTVLTFLSRYGHMLKTTAKKEKMFDIWTEGFRATGQQEQAHLLGKYRGRDFRHAVERYVNEYATKEIKELFNKEHLTIWGCKLYDNEEDARKTYG